jgi:hypothetical protein
MRRREFRTVIATPERVGGGETRYLDNFLTRGVEIHRAHHPKEWRENGEISERKGRAGKVRDVKVLLDPSRNKVESHPEPMMIKGPEVHQSVSYKRREKGEISERRSQLRERSNVNGLRPP